MASGLQSAADRGAVVATPALFEHAGDVDTVVFDKTGTLTTGEMRVRGIYTAGVSAETLQSRAAAVEQFSAHPIAEAITEQHSSERSPGADAVDVGSVEQSVRGLSASLGDCRVRVGHPSLFRDGDWKLPAALDQQATASEAAGDVPVVVGWDGVVRGVIVVGEQPRPEWESVTTALGRSRRIVVLTGDDGPAADRLRTHDAVDEVYAGVPPEGKAATVRRLAASETVAMVGDGSNDAPALAAADVGIALDSGTQLATEAADAVVLGGDLEAVPAALAVAAGTKQRIRENLAWAFLYNGIAVPLAISGVLNPLLAAAAMATSSLVVVANSARTPSGVTSEPPLERRGEEDSNSVEETVVHSRAGTAS